MGKRIGGLKLGFSEIVNTFCITLPIVNQI